ncbi:hypothetical protein BDV06DRAFT_29412 [Aspergillus oleicola]
MFGFSVSLYCLCWNLIFASSARPLMPLRYFVQDVCWLMAVSPISVAFILTVLTFGICMQLEQRAGGRLSTKWKFYGRARGSYLAIICESFCPRCSFLVVYIDGRWWRHQV